MTTVTTVTTETPAEIAEGAVSEAMGQSVSNVTPEEPSGEEDENLKIADEILQAQIDEVEQWRNGVNNSLGTLEMTQAEQGTVLSSLSVGMAEMSGVLQTLLTLAQPNPPPPLEERPEDQGEVENLPPLEPEVAEEPPPPPPPRRKNPWI
jgi:hypothetical protein